MSKSEAAKKKAMSTLDEDEANTPSTQTLDGRAARSNQTRQRIKEAFVELISLKGLDSLTVSDITRKANINRGTFYLHFVDKYDLLEQLEDETVSHLQEILLGERNIKEADLDEVFPPERICEALEFIESDYDFVSTIAGPGGDPQLFVKVKLIIGDLLDSGLARINMQIVGNEVFPETYAREMILSRAMSIIDLWLANGGEETPQQVANMICRSKDVVAADLIKEI